MTLRYDDRCKVTAVAPGTAAIPAASPAAVGAFIQIGAIANITNGDTVPYTITDGASLFENGYGTWNSVTGLARSTVKSNSSRNTSLINFPAAVTVFCGPIAASVALLDAAGNQAVPGYLRDGNPKFSAYLTGTQANLTGDGTVALVPFNTTEYNIGNGFDAGLHLFTAPVAGILSCNVGALMAPVTAINTGVLGQINTSGGRQYQLATANGSAAITAFGTNEISILGSLDILLAAAETVSLSVAVYGGTKIVGIGAGLGASWFTGEFKPT